MRTEAGSGVSRLGAPLGATAGSAAITDQGDVKHEEGTGRGDGLLPAAPLRTPPPPEGDERQCRLRAGPPTLSRHWPREVRPLSKETELGRLGRESLTQGRGETQSFEVALTVLLRPRGQTDRQTDTCFAVLFPSLGAGLVPVGTATPSLAPDQAQSGQRHLPVLLRPARQAAARPRPVRAATLTLRPPRGSGWFSRLLIKARRGATCLSHHSAHQRDRQRSKNADVNPRRAPDRGELSKRSRAAAVCPRAAGLAWIPRKRRPIRLLPQEGGAVAHERTVPG